MNYYQARQRTNDNRWCYTRKNDDRVWAVGYCADHEKEGHATYNGIALNQQLRCKVCGAWTQHFARVGATRMIFLCEEHLNKEEVDKLVEKPGWIVSSY